MVEKIKEIINQVFEEIGIKVDRIILFGSRARGEHEALSDYDIFVVIRKDIDNLEKRKLKKEIYRSLHLAFPFSPFDIIVKTKKEFEDEKDIVNTLSNEVLAEGIEI
uniref:Nucleotidyltransferase domain-containing protein n=1 Tax=Thermodesulfobacterium geofontis TaxID=1295609 RepID=A0A7V5XGX2_9BACT